MSARLSFRNLSVALGGRPIVRDATASFSGAHLVALVGPNGAGKTTLLKALLDLVRHEGEVEIDGRNARAMSARERAFAMSYSPQGHVIHWPLPASDVVALGRYARGAHDPSRLSEEDRRAVDAAMRATGAHEFADRRVTDLSGGERARIALARVLAAETPIILADEPIASLDPYHQISVMRALRRIADEDRLIIVVLHDLAIAARFADRMLVMQDGAIVADAPPRDAMTPELLHRVFRIRAVEAAPGGASAAYDAVES